MTAKNQPGFVAGTKLTVRVQANPGYGVESLQPRPNSPGVVAGAFTMTRSYSGHQNTAPNNALDPDIYITPPATGIGPSVVTDTVVVGSATKSISNFYVTSGGSASYLQTSNVMYGFRFARLGCTHVVVNTAFYRTAASDGSFVGIAPSYSEPQDACTAIIPWTAGGISSIAFSSGYFSKTYTGYVSSDLANLGSGVVRSVGCRRAGDTVPQIAYTADGVGSRQFGSANAVYAGGDPGADASHPSYFAGFPSDAMVTANEVEMFVVWRHTDCFSPLVSTPDGGRFNLSAIDFNYACADPSQFISNQPFVLAPTPFGAGTQVDPFISIGVNDHVDHTQDVPSDRSRRQYVPVGQPISVSSGVVEVRLNYCGALRTIVDFRNSARSSITQVTADRFDSQNFTQTGSCPLGQGEVGKTTYIGLSDSPTNGDTVSLAAQFILTYHQGGVVYGAEIAHVPMTVDAYGITGYTMIIATRRCYRLALGASGVAKTAANCPGSTTDLYLPGSTVQVDAIVNSPSVFRHWTSTGAATADDFASTSAYVVMNSDRTVDAVTEIPSFGEVAQTFASNIAKRIVAFTVYIVIGTLLDKLSFSVLTLVNLAIKGIALGLGAVGVPPAGVMWANKITASVDLAVGQFGNLTKCTTAWANGTDTGQNNDSNAHNLVGNGLKAGSAAAAGVSAVGTKISGVLNWGDAIRRSQAAALTSKLEMLPEVGAVIGVGASLYSAFGSNVSSYLSGDPATSWTSFGSSIGGCMKQNVVDHLADIQ